jgi:hypothetical protein
MRLVSNQRQQGSPLLFFGIWSDYPPFYVLCLRCITAKVGTRYFFLQKFVSPLALVRYSATAIFSVVRWQRCH